MHPGGSRLPSDLSMLVSWEAFFTVYLFDALNNSLFASPASAMVDIVSLLPDKVDSDIKT